MKKLPNIFKPRFDHYVNNNKEVYYSYLDNDKQDKMNRNANDLNKEKGKKVNSKANMAIINQLNNNSLLNKKVVIKTSNNQEYKTEILSKMGNNIILSNGKVVSIFDITDIEEK